MKNIVKEIEEIIIETNEKINNKLTGINFLEAFKFSIIPKLSTSLSSNFILENIPNEEKLIVTNSSKKLEANLIYNNFNNKELKKQIEKNILLINIKEILKIDILEKKSNYEYVSLNIYPFMGITLSSGTLVNLTSIKNSFFIQFFINEINNDIEKEKKDII